MKALVTKALLVTTTAVAVLALTGCTGGSPAAAPTTSTTSTTTSTTSSTPTPTVEAETTVATTSSSSTTTTSTTKAVRRSATPDVAGLLRAADAADAAIEKARKAIQSDLDSKQTKVRPQTWDLMGKAEAAVQKVSAQIPIGADAELLRPMLALYAVLDARRAITISSDILIEEPTNTSYRTRFADGVGFARRYADDRRAVQVAAAAHRPIVRQSPTSLAGAELAIRRGRIDITHICPSEGDHEPAADEFSKLLWTKQTPTLIEGKLDGYPFHLIIQDGRWVEEGGPDC